jgi:hypothetical protein
MLYIAVLVGALALALACLVFVMTPSHTRKH